MLLDLLGDHLVQVCVLEVLRLILQLKASGLTVPTIENMNFWVFASLKSSRAEVDMIVKLNLFLYRFFDDLLG